MATGSTLENSYGPEALDPTPVASPPTTKANLENVNNASQYEYSNPAARQRKPGFGLFGFLTGFAAATVIVGAAVGGGLGASLGSCHKSLKSQFSATTCSPNNPTPASASSTSLPTTASGLLMNYTAPEWQHINSVSYTCPLADFSTQTGDKFTFECGYDIGSGLRDSAGAVVVDIVGVVSYSIEDCAYACSEFNRRATQWAIAARCGSIAWGWDMKNDTQANGGNCWLKNGTVATGQTLYNCPTCISGKIV